MTAPAFVDDQAPPETPRKRRGGRPPKLTDEVMATILAELQRGAFFTIACRLAKVSPSIGYTWLEQGRAAKKGSKLRQFSESCALAIAQAEAKLTDVVWDAATKNKSAKISLAMLGRRFPARWSQRRLLKGDVNHRHGGQIGHLHAIVELPIEDLGKDSLPVEQVLERQRLQSGLDASRRIEPPAAERPDEKPKMRDWSPGPKKRESVTERARRLLEEQEDDASDE